MPHAELMSWIASQRRWMKNYRGRRYSVSPRQLGTEPTKEASRTKANQWWEDKQKEVDEALGLAKKHPAHVIANYEAAMENHRLVARWYRKYGHSPKLAEKSEAVIQWLQEALKSDAPPFPLTKWQEDPVWEQKRDEAGFFLWHERIQQIVREEKEDKAVPKEDTIRAHIDDYLAFRKAQVDAGQRRLNSYHSFKYKLLTFRQWVDPFAALGELNEDLWHKYYLYLLGLVAANKMSQDTVASSLVATRQFIRNRAERRLLINAPLNLTSRSLSISPSAKPVVVFSDDELPVLLSNAKGRTRLFILLMLNIGAYPSDIAFIRQEEMDWTVGRIIRKRTKTKKATNVPVVNYKLWAETFDLLKQYGSRDAEWVLMNRNGKPLWNEREKDGKYCLNSNVRSAFWKFQRKVGITKGLKCLRKTGASLLAQEYPDCVLFYLAHSPQTVADRSYVRPPQERFDESILWLGQQLGIE